MKIQRSFLVLIILVTLLFGILLTPAIRQKSSAIEADEAQAVNQQMRVQTKTE